MTKISDEQLTVTRVRPRFSIITDQEPKELIEKIHAALAQEDAPCIGKVYKEYGSISIPVAQQHYWSPSLKMTIERTDEGTEMRGLYGPRPAVWTMFVFFYSAIGFSIMVLSMMGMSYYSLGKSTNFVWLIPVLIVALTTLYAVAYFGKKKGYNEIVIIHDFVEKATGLSLKEEL